MRETLDETIDRVARGLTSVPADPSFAAQLQPELDGSPRSETGFMLAAAAAAIIAVAVLINVDMFERAAPPPVRPPIAAADSGRAQLAEIRESLEPTREPTRETATLVSAAPDVPSPQHEESSAIAALVPPEALDFEPLNLEPIVVDPVELAELELDTLVVPEIGAADRLDPSR